MQKTITKFSFIALLLLFILTSCGKSGPQVLVFTKTNGWHHSSIPKGIEAIQKLGDENGFGVYETDDAEFFTQDNLEDYNAVVFLNTNGNILNSRQEAVFERYIQAGGGYVGIYSAAATEYEWAWYGELMGAFFNGHPRNPGVRHGVVDIENSEHAATEHLPEHWERDEEWYNYQSFYQGINVLATLDESSYVGGMNGNYHPIAWYHEYDGGKAFYTGLGHQEETYEDSEFLRHILGGIKYAMSETGLDYSKAYAREVPEDNRFAKTVLDGDLASPMELAVSTEGEIYYTELRSANLKRYNVHTGNIEIVHQFNVNTAGGTGLIGVTLDPDFSDNGYIYLYYAPPMEEEPFIFNLSRFTITDDGSLDLASEKILLQVPVQENSGSHHGGSLAWDGDGNLFLSTGDSSSPFPADGYAPLDEREGEEFYSLDSQRSAGNTNDFKGKILRIHPEDDGTYTIPEGNLFPKGMAKTKPEIFVMGNRNPYRIAVNQETGTVYWGEIGPDAGEDSPRGPRGYDEFNQAKKAGFYGWPYFIADNLAYSDWDFETNTPGPKYDPENPINDSPNNTGLRELPPAQPAMIYYPYAASEKFPEFGIGGRSAMAGAFYHYDDDKIGENGFPEYYDGALFVFEWMRNWVKALRFDEQENYLRSEPFMSSNGDFRRPIDLAFGDDGVMYMLEYGSVYGLEDNDDARLVKIEYNGGNRAPRAIASIQDSVAQAELNQNVFLTSELKTLPQKKEIIGMEPLRVSFNGQGSSDPDNDGISYEWLKNGETFMEGPSPTYTFNESGDFDIVLKVTDENGSAAYDSLKVRVGNAQPEVLITSSDNKSFYWNEKPFKYNVEVSDPDGDINEEKISTTFSTKTSGVAEPTGKKLIATSDCKACHTVDQSSIGPSYMDIAERYGDQTSATDELARKIIKGGGGSWGTTNVMSAHPQISMGEATAIVSYILNIDSYTDSREAIENEGELQFPVGENPETYSIKAEYTDSGTPKHDPVSNEDEVVLRYAEVPSHEVDKYEGFQRWGINLATGVHKSYLYMKNVDLTNIEAFVFNYSAQDYEGEIEVRMDSFAGQVISKINYGLTDSWDSYQKLESELDEEVSEKHDLYFIMLSPDHGDNGIIQVRAIFFESAE